MYDYSEFCPVSKAASVLSERWTLQIIREMHFGASRFSEFQKYLPKLSPSLLNSRLRSLEQNGVILRKKIPEAKGYEYLLTPAGKELYPVLLAMGKWGMRWIYDRLSDDEMHAENLVRSISRDLNVDELPAGDTIIHFKFTDLDEYSNWYIKVQNKQCKVCDEVPDQEVDVHLTSDLLIFTEVWMGNLNLHRALDSGMIKMVAPAVYSKNVSKWLGLNVFARDNPKFEADKVEAI